MRQDDRPERRRRTPRAEQGQRPRYPDRDLFPRPTTPPRPPEKRYPPPKPGKWSRDMRAWWERRQREHDRERQKDDRRTPLPRPYLNCTSHFGPQLVALALNEHGMVSFPIWNDGNAPAWTCYVEVYEGPPGYSSPLSAYHLRGQAIITLQPGERREVPLHWVRRQRGGRIVGIVYDPLLDPRDFVLVEQVNRHITSVHWSNLD